MLKLFGIDLTLHKGHDLDFFRRKGHHSSYIENKAGQIIGIHIKNQKGNLKNVRISEGLEHLQYLNLSDNEQLSELIFEVDLPSLFHLDVSDSKVKKLSFGSGFNALERLDASRNDLELIEFKGNLPALEYLDLAENKLISLILPTGFNALKYLYANKNQLSSFKAQSSFEGLEILNLAENELEELPNGKFTNLQTLYVKGNLLGNYQQNLIEGNKSGNAVEIIGLLRAATGGVSPNFYAKLIIVGNGRVGKTCMVKRLEGEEECPDLPYTHGISISELTEKNLPDVDTKTDHLRLRIWDFGGQEVFYATHQFFLSEEAAYIYAWTDEKIALQNRKKDTINAPWQKHDRWRGHEYWLHNIRMHGKGSPILVVKTHCLDARGDFHYDRLNRTHHIDRLPLDFDAQSSEPKYLLNLKKEITDIVNGLPILGTPFPNSYRNAIDAITKAKEEGEKELSTSAFAKLADEAGIEKGDEDKLLSYLQKTGEVIHFPKMSKIKDRIFIDPEHLTSQLYKLIEDHDQLTKNNGSFTKEDAILKLGAEDWEGLLALLMAFELVFEKKSEGITTYIAPQYLTSNPNAFKVAKQERKLLFELKYPYFLPENVMINFLSHYGPYAAVDEIYQNIIFFKKENTRFGCIVETDFAKKRIKVYTNPEPQADEVGKDVFEKLLELSKETEIHIDVTGKEKWVLCEGLQNKLKENRDIEEIGGGYIDDKAAFGFLYTEHKLSSYERVAEKTDSPLPEKNIELKEMASKSEIIIAEIQNLVGKNRLEKAIEVLLNNLSGEEKTEVLGLKRRFSQVKTDDRKGIITGSDADVQYNKIADSILKLSNFIGKKTYDPAPEQTTKPIATTTTATVAAANNNITTNNTSDIQKSPMDTNKNKRIVIICLALIVVVSLFLWAGASGKISMFGLFDVEINDNDKQKIEQTTETMPERGAVIGKVQLNGQPATSSQITAISISGDNRVNPTLLTSDSRFILENVKFPAHYLIKIAFAFSDGREEIALVDIKGRYEDGAVDVRDVLIDYDLETTVAPGEEKPPVIIKIYNTNVAQSSSNINSDGSGNQTINQ